jgi:hypothetical protein
VFKKAQDSESRIRIAAQKKIICNILGQFFQHRHWWRSTGTGGATPALVAQLPALVAQFTGTGGAVPALVAQHRHWWRSV